MGRRVAIVCAIAVLAAGGWIMADRWDRARLAACEQRGARMAALDLLTRQPTGFRPTTPAAGCDVDRVVAYASRQFIVMTGTAVDQLAGRSAVTIDQAAVIAFYRRTLTDDGWQIASRPPSSPGPDAAALCAAQDLPIGKAYVNLSFPYAGAYQLMVADDADSGARCT